MRSFLGIIIALCPFLTKAQNTQKISGTTGKGIHFIESLSWRQLKDSAKAQNKYIFLDCYATWCGPCKEMDIRTFSDDSVGELFNSTFLSAKIQCDTSKNDEVNVVRSYADAHQIISEFHITGYPTFLFFSPDGKIVSRAIGYYNPENFISLVKNSMISGAQYDSGLREYRNGGLDYSLILLLANKAKELDDTALFSSAANRYLRHLDESDDSTICTINNLKLIETFIKYLSSKDRVFSCILTHLDVGDSVMRRKGFSNGVINYVIYNEEMAKSIKDGKKSGIAPNWILIRNKMTSKYEVWRSEKIIQKGKMQWFYYLKDWENYCATAIEIIEKGDFIKNLGDRSNLDIVNDFAYEVFQRSNDKDKLEKVLSWTEHLMNAITDSSVHAEAYIDTRAQLLYRLGRREEAVVLETRAIKIAPDSEFYRDVLQKMREGKSTW